MMKFITLAIAGMMLTGCSTHMCVGWHFELEHSEKPNEEFKLSSMTEDAGGDVIDIINQPFGAENVG
ncbi:MAG: hypothetical protein PVI43_01255 [Candidatus Bathyarchaeota archaeon]|jgi:hypothetical protein